MYSSTMPMASSQNTRKLPNDLPTEYRDHAPPRNGVNLSPLTVRSRTSGTLVYDGLASPESNSFSNARARELFGTVRIREQYRNLSNPSVPYYPQPNSPSRVGTPVRDLQVTGLQLSETAGRSYMDEPPTTQLIGSNTNKPPVRIYSPVLQTVNSYSGSVTSKGMSSDPRDWSVGKGSHRSNDGDPNRGELVYARRIISETHTSGPLSPQNQPALVSSNPVAVPRKYSHTTLPKNLDKMYDQMRLNGSSTVGPDRPSSPARVDWMERKLTPDAPLAEPLKVRSDRPPGTYIPVPPAASNATSTSIVPYGVKNTNERSQSRNTNYPPPPPYSAIANGAEKSPNQSSTGIYGPVYNRIGTTSTEKPPEAVSGFDAPHRGPHVGLLNHGNTVSASFNN
ncbi:hypothetical protein FGIG_08082 [Fasciola gigantica]|uniref:Uncharacterized protein n=1 Tax=Fasciola gigantica TaxID=46835 RepID=A0A504YN94_FASGI|nr:hypothetical protein FGIG_08082 [Fasciola gigantica]